MTDKHTIRPSLRCARDMNDAGIAVTQLEDISTWQTEDVLAGFIANHTGCDELLAASKDLIRYLDEDKVERTIRDQEHIWQAVRVLEAAVAKGQAKQGNNMSELNDDRSTRPTTTEMLSREPQLEAENEELKGAVEKLEEENLRLSVEIGEFHNPTAPEPIDTYISMYWFPKTGRWLCSDQNVDKRIAEDDIRRLLADGQSARLIHVKESVSLSPSKRASVVGNGGGRPSLPTPDRRHRMPTELVRTCSVFGTRKDVKRYKVTVVEVPFTSDDPDYKAGEFDACSRAFYRCHRFITRGMTPPRSKGDGA